jgi:hypothetical protein
VSDGTSSPWAVRIAWFAVILIAALILLGEFWYGFSAEIHHRIWRDIADRPGGPMTFRFILQPVMAAIAAFHDGIRDAQLGRAPYFWTVLHDPAERRNRVGEAFISIGRIILLGIGMDIIYQSRVLGTFYPGEAVLITLILAVLPYFLLRGPICRVARRRLAVTPETKSEN